MAKSFKPVCVSPPFIAKGRKCYYVTLTITDAKTGAVRRLKKSTDVKVDDDNAYHKACKASMQILADAQANHDPSPPITLEAYSMIYLAECEAKNLSPSYLRQTKSAFQAFVSSIGGETLITHISAQQARTFLFEKKSASSALAYHRCLRAGFEVATRDGKLAQNPFDQVDVKALRKKHRVRPRGILSQKQVGEIYTTLPKDSYGKRLVASFFLFLFGTAMRRSEACYLYNSAVDMERKEISIKPTVAYGLKSAASASDIPLTEYALIALQEQNKNRREHSKAEVRESIFVFCNEEGKAYHPDSLTKMVQKHLKPICEQLGIECAGLDLHSLRHSLSQLLIDAGAETAIVSKFLRHGSISTTLGSYHKNADVNTTFDSVLRITGKVSLSLPVRNNDAWVKHNSDILGTPGGFIEFDIQPIALDGLIAIADKLRRFPIEEYLTRKAA